MSDWSLPRLLENLHKDIEHQLSTVRSSFAHPGTKGDGSEKVWLDLFNTYLPERYKAAKAFVVDSTGAFSEQQDVVIFDRQYSPFVFHYNEEIVIPAESVYAVFEAKQSANRNMIEYAQKKAASVRKLHRTSLPIPYAKGTYPAKPLIPIISGFLCLSSEWSPPLGHPLLNQLKKEENNGLINIGCIASHGHFFFDSTKMDFDVHRSEKAATAFLFKLISELQFCGTVPMIDIQAYGEWLLKR